MGGQDVETASLDHPSEELAVKGLREMGGRCPGMRGQGECCKTWACSSTERKMVLPGEARGEGAETGNRHGLWECCPQWAVPEPGHRCGTQAVCEDPASMSVDLRAAWTPPVHFPP